MRRAARTDDNQEQIVSALRQVGASVLIMSQLGGGAPDLAVGIFGRTYFLEVKDGSKPPSQQRLTPEEAIFQNEWKGHYRVVHNVDEAMAAIHPRL